jgi:multiple antibiotic resistance protein
VLHEIAQLLGLVGVGLLLMLPLANPLTSMSLLMALGKSFTEEERNRQINQATGYVIGIMLVAYYGGNLVMDAFGISIPGLRIAGGLIVSYIGFSMLFPNNTLDSIPEADQTADAIRRRETPNIAFVPLALPGTAGPGTIAMIISATSTLKASPEVYPVWVVALSPLLIFFTLGGIFWICLRSSRRLVTLAGPGGIEAISRIMGFMLICMGVQFVINGIVEITTSLHTIIPPQ